MRIFTSICNGGIRPLAIRPPPRYNQSMEEDIMKLQEMVSYQQEEISRLSDELYLQQKHIAELHRALRSLNTRVEEIGDAQGDGTPEPPPPHY